MNQVVSPELKENVENLFKLKRYGDRDVHCVFCGHEKIYVLGDGSRYKCRSCRKKFRNWTGTFLARCRLTPIEVYKLVWSFSIGFNALSVSKKMNLSYQTVFDFYHLLRESIAEKTYDECVSGSEIYVFNFQLDRVSFDLCAGIDFDDNCAFYLKNGERMVNDNHQGNSAICAQFISFSDAFMSRYRGYLNKNIILYLQEICWRFNTRRLTLSLKVDGLLSALLNSR